MIQGWFPENASTYGSRIDDLFYLILWITGAAFVITQGLLLVFLVRYRRRRGGARAAYVTGERPRQMAWILVPLAAVFALDVWIDVRGAEIWDHVRREMPESRHRLHVVGSQFNWTVYHAGPDGRIGTADDLKLENEMHVPVGEVVRVSLASKDVIHSFFVPELRLKQDVVPGRTIDVWFQATRPGRFECPCAELCGFGHSGMRGYLYVHTPEEYAAWVRKRWPDAAAPAPGPERAGGGTGA